MNSESLVLGRRALYQMSCIFSSINAKLETKTKGEAQLKVGERYWGGLRPCSQLWKNWVSDELAL